ncbi:MAG: ABC transporter substrate-binding protein [Spirochaetales bacterium]|nr:ABC transporter substrate-binding protein [Spirochaetales bacterium]
MFKRIIFILILLPPVVIYAGGNQEASSGDQKGGGAVSESIVLDGSFSLEVTDSAGKVISLDSPPVRVVSLGPNITETVYALGKGHLLVGRSDWCNYPPEVESISPVGDIQSPSVETILSLGPDLILASSHAPMEELDLLTNAGVASAVFYGPQEFTGAYEVLRGVAGLLGAQERGEEIISEMSGKAGRVEEKVSGMVRKPSVYFVVGFGEGGDWTAGGGTFINEMITMAGGLNIAGDVDGWSYSLEKLIEKDPEIILINNGLGDIFSSAPFYSDLTAVKEGHVYEVDENVIVRQGPRLAEGLEILNNVFTSYVE